MRAYRDTEITKVQIETLLKAGAAAPNACNFQSWYFYAITDRSLIRSLNGDVARIPWAENIPLAIVVCIREEVSSRLSDRFGERGRIFTEHDAAGAINHILLKAADMGLGGCWIGPYNEALLREKVGIAPNHRPTAILTIGLPDGEVTKRPREDLSGFVSYR